MTRAAAASHRSSCRRDLTAGIRASFARSLFFIAFVSGKFTEPFSNRLRPTVGYRFCLERDGFVVPHGRSDKWVLHTHHWMTQPVYIGSLTMFFHKPCLERGWSKRGMSEYKRMALCCHSLPRVRMYVFFTLKLVVNFKCNLAQGRRKTRTARLGSNPQSSAWKAAG